MARNRIRTKFGYLRQRTSRHEHAIQISKAWCLAAACDKDAIRHAQHARKLLRDRQSSGALSVGCEPRAALSEGVKRPRKSIFARALDTPSQPSDS